jgi:cell division protease FtsH
MKQRKSLLPKILLTLVIVAVLGFMIWWLVNLNKPKATQLTLGNAVNEDGEISLRIENKDVNLLSAQEQFDGDIVYVQGYYTFEEAGTVTTPVELPADKILTYVFTVTESQWTGVYGTSETTMYQYFVSSIEENITLYTYEGKVLSTQTNYFGWFTPTIVEESTFLSWLPTIIYILVLVVGGYFLIRILSGSVNGANNKAMDFNKSRARRVEVSNVKFGDVAGCEEEKQEMTELVEYLKNPNKYTSAGAKLPKGVLLVGAPGTGKTLLAKAVAGEAGVPFFSISGSDFVEMFVGVGAGRVRDMFKNAKQNAPCIIFIDEIDAVGRQRGAGLGGGNDEREQTLNQLLVEMDGFADNAGIIVIAATNRDDVLDPALLRAGRFDRKITVSLPDKAGREAIFKVHARNKKIDTAVDFGNLAKRTVGFSGADIASVLNDAAILSVRNGSPLITLAEIDEAIDRRIAGPAKSSRALSELERKTIAYHEAGHAIIGLNLPFSDKVQKITIVPRGNTGGHVLMTPEDDRFLVTKNELMAKITGYLGGRTSEEVFFDDISTGAHNDIEVATRIARAMVVEYGMSSLGPIQYEQVGGNVFLGRDYTSAQRNFSQEVALAIDKEIRHIVDTCHAQARKVIEEHRDDLILIANTLLERESITAEQIDYLLKYRTLDVFPAEPQQNAEILEDVTPIEPNSGDVIDE